MRATQTQKIRIVEVKTEKTPYIYSVHICSVVSLLSSPSLFYFAYAEAKIYLLVWYVM